MKELDSKYNINNISIILLKFYKKLINFVHNTHMTLIHIQMDKPWAAEKDSIDKI